MSFDLFAVSSASGSVAVNVVATVLTIVVILACLIGAPVLISRITQGWVQRKYRRVVAAHPGQRDWYVVALRRSYALLVGDAEIRLVTLDGRTEHEWSRHSLVTAVVEKAPAGIIGLPRPALRLDFRSGSPISTVALIFPTLGSLWSSRESAEQVREILLASPEATS